MRKRQKRARSSLLRRLLEEIENFTAYFDAKLGRMEKGILGETIRLDIPTRRKLHPQILAILKQLLGEQTDTGGGGKAKKKIGKAKEGNNDTAWRDSDMADRCAICGVEAEDVFEVTQTPKVVNSVGEMLKAKELDNILVLDIPVTKLCAYCADLHGVKHPDPDIAEKVAHYTDLMKHAVPKLPEHVEKPTSSPKIDVDKVDPVLVEQMKEFVNLARKMEKLLGAWAEKEENTEEDED